LPLRPSAVSGGEFSHSTAPDKGREAAFDRNVGTVSVWICTHHHGGVSTHHDGWRFATSTFLRFWVEAVEEFLFDGRRVRERDIGEKAGIEPGRDPGDGD
jgi:hypothetical protein